MGNLSNLETLYLGFNELTGPIPAELGNLSNLKSLNLSNNRLTGPIPAELGSLSNLEYLQLGGNQLTGCIPQNLRRIQTNDLSQLGLPFCDMPGAPTIATPIVPGDASLTVAWAAPINTGSSAITAYDLRHTQSSADEMVDANWTVVEDVWTTDSGSLQYTLTGLTGGTQYDVQVRAVNTGRPRRLVGHRHRDHDFGGRAGSSDRPDGHGERTDPDQPVVERPGQRWRVGHHRLPHRSLSERFGLERPGNRHRVHQHQLLPHRPDDGDHPALPGVGDQLCRDRLGV